MKIKPLLLTKDDLENGFSFNEIYDVKEISIAGDPTAYDIFYKIHSKDNIVVWVQDISVEEIEIDDNIQKFYHQFNKMFDENLFTGSFDFNMVVNNYDSYNN